MPRNMQGFGANGVNYLWPDNKKIALNFVINYEEGAEHSPVYGDEYSEYYGGEFLTKPKAPGQRNMSMESLFEYGSRVGIWRLLRLFDGKKVPLTFFVSAKSLEQNAEFASYLKNSNHEVAGHGYRWFDYADYSKESERADILKCMAVIKEYTSKKIVGWYTGRRSENTRELLLEIGGFKYDSDSYADDLPYFENQHLVIPYTLINNDFRLCTNPGFASSTDFFQHLKDTFDYLLYEDRTNLMSIGLHARISGHPGRCLAVARFLEYVLKKDKAWLASRNEIADWVISQRRSMK